MGATIAWLRMAHKAGAWQVSPVKSQFGNGHNLEFPHESEKPPLSRARGKTDKNEIAHFGLKVKRFGESLHNRDVDNLWIKRYQIVTLEPGESAQSMYNSSMNIYKASPSRGEVLMVTALAFVAGLDVAALWALVQAAAQVG